MSGQGTLIAGRYRLERKIGSGAMGVVWESLDERLNRTVAVKQLLLQPALEPNERDEAVERTLREGRIAARLHHPNAISVFDVVDNDGVPCLVMEYLPSRSLDDVIRERGSISPGDVATIGAQVAAALAAAHDAGIVHRDIKPGNVLLGRGGQVKITDFGISRATDDITVTKTGLIAGTPAYLAPEVAVGREPLPPSDVFSLGSTLYAAVEGEPPFGLSDNTLSLLHVVARGQINPPRQAGPLTEVLEALLRADPDSRPTARDASGMLRAVSQGQAPDVPPDPNGGTTAVMAGQNPATRAMTSALPAQGTQVRPAAEEEQVGPPPRKSRKALWLSLLALLVLAAIVLGLWAGGVFGAGEKKPQLPVPSAPSSTVELPTTTPEDTTVEDTTPQEPTRTREHRETIEPTTTRQRETTTTEPTPTTEAPTTTPNQTLLPGGGGDNNGGGGGGAQGGPVPGGHGHGGNNQ
ncbi:serine/threonine-protein kinase [Sciscionella sediminilitoris]|uniref:serine/threonine-protein kinase n=1 Tax=Sciscionella sediminilitoris TaxID=1445613 RepID=UPI000568991E|nr:serine/threonine-protein kinase [Sciscionella sp. SE31]